MFNISEVLAQIIVITLETTIHTQRCNRPAGDVIDCLCMNLIYSGMNVRIMYESSTTSNVVGLSVRHNNTRIHVRVRQEVGYRQHGGRILCQ